MLYSCTHMVTVGIKGLSDVDIRLFVCRQHRRLTPIRQKVPLLVMMQQYFVRGEGLSS